MIFDKTPQIRFMKRKAVAFGISGLMILAGLVMFVTKDFNLGIDFTGGTMIEAAFRQPRKIKDLRALLSDNGLGQATIQTVGKDGHRFFIKAVDVSVKTDLELDEHEKVAELVRQALTSDEDKAAREKGLVDLNQMAETRMTEFLAQGGLDQETARESAEKIIGIQKASETGLIDSMDQIKALDIKNRVKTLVEEKGFLGSFTFLSVEIVGPQVGHDLRKKASLATIFALLGMLVYIAFRFRFVYGMAAVVTLAHDIMVVLGFILVFQIEVSLTVVAAILTIVGYSLNDTIVIFDRVRDNSQNLKAGTDVEELLDRSINQTLSRTLMTSGTTLLTVLALFFLGGEVINTFSSTLLVGVAVGTYSSIYQSCAWLSVWKKYLLKNR